MRLHRSIPLTSVIAWLACVPGGDGEVGDHDFRVGTTGASTGAGTDGGETAGDEGAATWATETDDEGNVEVAEVDYEGKIDYFLPGCIMSFQDAACGEFVDWRKDVCGTRAVASQFPEETWAFTELPDDDSVVMLVEWYDPDVPDTCTDLDAAVKIVNCDEECGEYNGRCIEVEILNSECEGWTTEGGMCECDLPKTSEAVDAGKDPFAAGALCEYPDEACAEPPKLGPIDSCDNSDAYEGYFGKLHGRLTEYTVGQNACAELASETHRCTDWCYDHDPDCTRDTPGEDCDGYCREAEISPTCDGQTSTVDAGYCECRRCAAYGEACQVDEDCCNVMACGNGQCQS